MITLGICLTIFGLVFRFLAVASLGEFWRNFPAIPDKVIKSGIYRLTKHPAYWGTFLIFLGLFLAIPYQYHFVVFLYWIATFYVNRAEYENYLIDIKQNQPEAPELPADNRFFISCAVCGEVFPDARGITALRNPANCVADVCSLECKFIFETDKGVSVCSDFISEEMPPELIPERLS